MIEAVLDAVVDWKACRLVKERKRNEIRVRSKAKQD
jgi:hypothetical protein